MKKKLSKLLDTLFATSLVTAVLWIVVAHVIFKFRHPWMTDFERICHTHRAITLDRVPYHEARP